MTHIDITMPGLYSNKKGSQIPIMMYHTGKPVGMAKFTTELSFNEKRETQTRLEGNVVPILMPVILSMWKFFHYKPQMFHFPSRGVMIVALYVSLEMNSTE